MTKNPDDIEITNRKEAGDGGSVGKSRGRKRKNRKLDDDEDFTDEATEDLRNIVKSEKTMESAATKPMLDESALVEEKGTVQEGAFDDRENARPEKRKQQLPKTLERAEASRARLLKRLRDLEARINMKEDIKTVSLTTSKINYLDPRITVSWCKRQRVPVNKILTKTMIERFQWALEEGEEFVY